MQTLELVATISPLFGDIGSSFYFTPETGAAGEALGLDIYRFYFLGRGGVLGDVTWQVAFSTFGYFSPSLFAHMWTTGTQRCQPSVAAKAHLEACAAHGRARLSEVADLDQFCRAAESVVASATFDAAGLTLFAGYASQDLPDDLPGRALTLIATLRELRGSAHLSAVVARGLPTRVAHRIKRPDDVSMFGWKEGEIAEPTPQDRDSLDAAEETTNHLLTRPYSVIDSAAGDALLNGAMAIAAALGLR